MQWRGLARNAQENEMAILKFRGGREKKCCFSSLAGFKKILKKNMASFTLYNHILKADSVRPTHRFLTSRRFLI